MFCLCLHAEWNICEDQGYCQVTDKVKSKRIRYRRKPQTLQSFIVSGAFLMVPYNMDKNFVWSALGIFNKSIAFEAGIFRLSMIFFILLSKAASSPLFIDSSRKSSIALHISSTPFGSVFRYLAFSAKSGVFISSGSEQRKSCIRIPKGSSPE